MDGYNTNTKKRTTNPPKSGQRAHTLRQTKSRQTKIHAKAKRTNSHPKTRTHECMQYVWIFTGGNPHTSPNSCTSAPSSLAYFRARPMLNYRMRPRLARDVHVHASSALASKETSHILVKLTRHLSLQTQSLACRYFRTQSLACRYFRTQSLACRYGVGWCFNSVRVNIKICVVCISRRHTHVLEDCCMKYTHTHTHTHDNMQSSWECTLMYSRVLR